MKTHANKTAVALTAAIIGSGVLTEPAAAQSGAASEDELVARGRYLVTTSACHDCHTPLMLGPNGPEPDFSRMLSGHPQDLVMPPAPAPVGPWTSAFSGTNTAWAGPWGVSFTANLTPDPDTGLGRWTLRNFVDTVRSGRHMGRGREILPPMPIPMYKNFIDEDLTAIFAFLQSIPPVSNRVPEPRPPATEASQ